MCHNRRNSHNHNPARLFCLLHVCCGSFLPSIQHSAQTTSLIGMTRRRLPRTLHHTRTDRRGTCSTCTKVLVLLRLLMLLTTIPTPLQRHRLDAPAGSRDPHTLVYHASRVQSTSPITAIRAAKAPCTTPIIHHHSSPHPTAELARSAPWRPASRKLSAISYTTRGNTAH